MEKREAKELLKKYHAGTCTDEEKALLESWYLDWQGGEFDLSDKSLKILKSQTFKRIKKSYKKERSLPHWYRYAAAVIAFVMVSVGIVLYISKKQEQKGNNTASMRAVVNDVAPGSNKALLTLADGTVVKLDEARTGSIAEVAGITIRKTKDGQVVYEAAVHASNKTTSISYNQISTPRGGQFKITLPDGTKVWLNAASSLKYPVRFTETIRRVELTGEGYFEVNSQQLPNGDRVAFLVSTPTQNVEVLGTHFNINSYGDEKAILTTLVEGKVRVTDGHTSVLLKPGQQASLTANNFNVKKIDTEEAVAWKNGYFSFDQADLQSVMLQLSRWYDVDVVYKAGELPSETFTGKVYRNMSLSKVLDMLAFAKVNFKMEGKKMIITP
ncbi:FecR family protein [Pedobacter nyackensis]|uniref:FecR family protein n=1 Tax=Pedobacter nyackensis TaxID=475255 RepID=A0A1W2EUC9_9SPHI|nr:FecR family protein [Pedobacter nyackensis]SMD13261.1 FecR family protein [Pedobacter nyackensis]